MAGDQTYKRYLPPATRVAALAVCYAAGAHLAITLSDLSVEHFARIWPANGIAIGFLLVAPRRHWPAYLCAVAAGNALASLDVQSDYDFYACLTLINMLEIVLAAYPMRMLLGRADLSKRTSLPTFFGCAVLLAPLVSSIIAAITIDAYFDKPLFPTALHWFLADGIGTGIVTPVVLALHQGKIAKLFAEGQRHWTLLYILAVTAVVVGVFYQVAYPLLFIIPPAMLLVALRLGHAGVALMVPILTLIALTLGLSAHGPAALNKNLNMAESIQLTQLFLFVTSLLSFWIANSEAERRQITDALQASVDKLALLAAADGMTQLGNRRSFDDALSREWRRCLRSRKPMSIVMIDVDHFKAFNDRYGHLRGDDCLKRIATATAQALKRPADLAFRYGGEEFVVVLPETDAHGAAIIAEEIRSRIEAIAIPHDGSTTSSVVTASLGTATLEPRNPTSFRRPQDMMEWADSELYSAKQMGRNCVSARVHRILRAV